MVLICGPSGPGAALLRCGDVQKQLGAAERKFVQSANIHFLRPLRSFSQGGHALIQVRHAHLQVTGSPGVADSSGCVKQDERQVLQNTRLDLDVTKSRLRRAQEADREARVSPPRKQNVKPIFFVLIRSPCQNLDSGSQEQDYVSQVSYMFSFLRVKWLKVRD